MENKQNELTIKPLSVGGTFLCFGIPTAIFAVGFYIIMPALIEQKITPFNAYWISMGIPFIVMFCCSLIAFRMEGNPFVWKIFKDRYRIHYINGKTWLWALLVFIATFLGYAIVSSSLQPLFNLGIIELPAFLPAWLDPRTLQSVSAWDDAFGGLKGNWFAAISYLIFLFFNVVGEELWWRGYILPRQEVVLHKWTWVVHGLLWGCFHIFKWWDLPGIFILTLALSYVVYRTKNTSLGIVLHFLGNSIAIVPILIGILKTN
jgi:membrane protease YdiL (CAAX protease family)